MLAQDLQRIQRNGHTGSGGNAVENHRQLRLAGDGLIMGNQPLLSGFIVVGRYAKLSVRSQCFGQSRPFNHISGIISARSGDDGDAAVHLRHRAANDLLPFSKRKRSWFARGAAGNQGLDAVFKLIFNQLFQRLNVDASVLLHRGDQRGGRSLKKRGFHPFFLPS